MTHRPREPHLPTAGPVAEDGRDAQELSPEENANLCAGCVKCCTYITVQIDTPRSAWEYDQWIWALHHRGVSLYVEKPERWFLHFETVCDQLGPDGRCAIHGRHPVLCRDYDPRSCERRLPLSDIAHWFDNGASFEAWLKAQRPAHHRRLIAYRRDMPPGPPVAETNGRRHGAQGLIRIGDPPAAGAARELSTHKARSGRSPASRRSMR